MINDFHARPNSKNATKPANIGEHIAKAKDQMHVEVTIPSAYKDRAVEFAAEILDIRLNNLKSQKRVVIQQRSGVVIIGDDVTIEPVAIHHKNLVISTKAPTNGFVGSRYDQYRQGYATPTEPPCRFPQSSCRT